MERCTKCGSPLAPGVEECPNCVALAPNAPAAPVAQPGRPHSPTLAKILAILIPGAGQAYNGRPIKGFFLFFLSVLILPYLYSIYDAGADAERIVSSGGRMGKGGLIWVFLQGWLMFNATLLALLALTFAGYLT